VTGLDHEVDVLVVGSGAAGMTAALTAKASGLDTLLVEKAQYYGGTTAISGGGIWAPNAPEIVRERGFAEPTEPIVSYLETITEGVVARERLVRFVESAPAMIDFLERISPHLRFEWARTYPDYYPNVEGGSVVSRSIHVRPIDLRRLGDDEPLLRPQGPAMAAPKGAWITAPDLELLLSLRRSWRGKLMLLRLMGRMLRTRVTGERIAAAGQALVARLRLALRDADVPLWLESPVKGLITGADGCVVGAEVERDGTVRRVRTRRAVIMASGGFDHDLELRRRYQPTIEEDWSMGIPDLVGDGIRAGEAVGAAVDLMDDAWWMPSIRWPAGHMGLLVAERMIPGQFIVNAAGQRFVNEASPYTEFVHRVIAGHRTGVSHIPTWLIIDDRSWRQHLFGGHLPLPRIPAPVPTGREVPLAWREAGMVETAEDWETLAERIGVPPDALRETAQRFNAFARNARDEDFHRGESAYDNYYGDPRLPNPNLREVSQAPYYAFKIFPGDLGTKGGLVTDERARVLRADGEAIPGLYAAGNVSAALMGRTYAGAGSTISPAMTFGYVAARDAAALPRHAPRREQRAA
jgi:succinate dehydrogenase/fumarate reductase flavoprotein subunit